VGGPTRFWIVELSEALLLKLLHPALNLGRMPVDPFVVPMVRVSVSAAGGGDSALGEFEMAELYSGNGLRMLRMIVGVFACSQRCSVLGFRGLCDPRVLDGASGRIESPQWRSGARSWPGCRLAGSL